MVISSYARWIIGWSSNSHSLSSNHPLSILVAHIQHDSPFSATTKLTRSGPCSRILNGPSLRPYGWARQLGCLWALRGAVPEPGSGSTTLSAPADAAAGAVVDAVWRASLKGSEPSVLPSKCAVLPSNMLVKPPLRTRNWKFIPLQRRQGLTSSMRF